MKTPKWLQNDPKWVILTRFGTILDHFAQTRLKPLCFRGTFGPIFSDFHRFRENVAPVKRVVKTPSF